MASRGRREPYLWNGPLNVPPALAAILQFLLQVLRAILTSRTPAPGKATSPSPPQPSDASGAQGRKRVIYDAQGRPILEDDGTHGPLIPIPASKPQPPLVVTLQGPSARLSAISQQRLEGVHPDLIRVLNYAIEVLGVRVGVPADGGVRTLERQKVLLARKVTKTLASRHLTGHAMDICPLAPGGSFSWDWNDYYPLADNVKEAARRLGIPIEWGGDWKTFKDGPHWQLPAKEYPA